MFWNLANNFGREIIFVGTNGESLLILIDWYSSHLRASMIEVVWGHDITVMALAVHTTGGSHLLHFSVLVPL